MNKLELQIKSFDEVDGQVGVFEAYGNVKWVIDRVRDCTIDNAYTWNAERLPKMLRDHDHKQVCGAWLEIREDEKGLWVKGQLALNTQLGRETYELLKMGALDSLSIGYIVKKERYDSRTNINYLEEIDIREISVVAFECNQESLVESVKSDELKMNYKNIDDLAIHEEQEEAELINESPESEVKTESENELNTVVEVEEQKQELVPQEVMQKLDELVLSIKLSQIL